MTEISILENKIFGNIFIFTVEKLISQELVYGWDQMYMLFEVSFLYFLCLNLKTKE